MSHASCRSCGSSDLIPVIDLGMQPLANNLLTPADIGKDEPRFPLDVHVCSSCWLMQIGHTVPPVSLFSDYIYFSSFSEHMLSHASEASQKYIKEKSLNKDSFVIEVASNDGYLLKNFVAAGIPCLGFEPAANIAEVAKKRGVETHCEFFGKETAMALASMRGKADLILGNNVFAHAPDINDFISGLRSLLKPDGWIVLEFPYGVEMIDHVEFDTIYHEHVFYLTLTPLTKAFSRQELDIFHVERLPIHGGSLRLFACHRGAETIRDSVRDLQGLETSKGVDTPSYYQVFGQRARKVKSDLQKFLVQQKDEGKRVAAYGASAKGSTLLNYVGEEATTIEFIADRSTYKQGRLSPGHHIPIVDSDQLILRAPHFALLLVWNFADEVLRQQQNYSANGGQFVIPIPHLKII